MNFDFHGDNELYFNLISATAQHHILPFVEPYVHIRPGLRVLDVGCGTGGVLQAFLAAGCIVTGVDLNQTSIGTALGRFSEAIAQGRARFLVKNVYDFEASETFDLIIFKDSIEHIPRQQAVLAHTKRYLSPGGAMFFGFPPWAMPFGGHQQIIYQNKWLGKLPWYHLLPRKAYAHILREGGLPEHYVAELLNIQETGISTRRFERIAAAAGFRVVARQLWLLNPVYKYKFGIGPVPQPKFLGGLPGIRDVFGTAAYYVLQTA